MKSLQDQVKGGVIPFMSDQEILDDIVPSDNRQNMPGRGRRLPGGGSTSHRSTHRPVGQDYITRQHITEVLRREEQEKELMRKQAQEAQQRALVAEQEAKLAKEQANAAYSRVGTFESYLEQFFSHYNQQGNPFPVPFPRPNPAPFPGPFPFPGPAGFQAPFPGPISPFPDPNNSFNNCYRPSFPNSTTCPGSSSNYAMPPPDLNKYILQNNPHLSRIPDNNYNNDDSDEESEAAEESDEE